MKLLFVLSHSLARQRAIEAVKSAADGFRVVISEIKRTTDQNDLMWALLSDVSTQHQHYGQWYDTEDWKVILMHGLNKEMRIAPAYDGQGFVPLGRSSSKLGKSEMSDLIEFIYAFGAQHGVRFHNKKQEAA